MSTDQMSNRHAEILQRLRQQGYSSVETIARELGVSEMTIRRDLKVLQERGLISRHHGGASLIPDPGKVEMPYQLRSVGPLALRALKSINANIAFISITGLSLTKGLTTRDMHIAEIKRAMMDAAEKVVLVMDSSKMHKYTLTTVAQLKDVDMLVTDAGLSSNDRNAIEGEGVKVILASN